MGSEAHKIRVDALIGVFTKKRTELLIEINRAPSRTVYEIAKLLGRDYKNVHQDIVRLESVGLVSNNDGLRINTAGLKLQLIVD